ncbi:MAG: VOC family protein [Pseudomonadota bacterium]
MAIQLSKDSIDLGIVTSDGEAALKFYRDTLGLEHVADTPFPMGGTMHRLMCGTSLIKIVVPTDAPPNKPAGGPIAHATGFRYWTMIVSNLSEIMTKVGNAGYKFSVPETEIRPGVKIGIVEDPDGNLVEFVQMEEQ